MTARMAAVWRCMLALVVLMFLCLWGSTQAVGGAKSRPRPQRRPRKKPKVEPIDVTPPAQNIDIERVRNVEVTDQYCMSVSVKCFF